ACVEDVERADDRVGRGEAERLEVEHLPPRRERARDVGKQIRERAPLRAAGRGRVLFLQQQAEVVLQRALHRVLHRQRQRLGRRRALRYAAEERPLGNRPRGLIRPLNHARLLRLGGAGGEYGHDRQRERGQATWALHRTHSFLFKGRLRRHTFRRRVWRHGIQLRRSEGRADKWRTG